MVVLTIPCGTPKFHCTSILLESVSALRIIPFSISQEYTAPESLLTEYISVAPSHASDVRAVILLNTGPVFVIAISAVSTHPVVVSVTMRRK